jgi:hypothetical protein
MMGDVMSPQPMSAIPRASPGGHDVGRGMTSGFGTFHPGRGECSDTGHAPSGR